MAKKEPKIKKDKKNSFKSFKAELKKVIWPTPKQLVNNTMAVVAIVLILAAIVFVLDVAFEAANKYGIDKIKESIVSINSVDENTTTDNEAENDNASDETAEQLTDSENVSSENSDTETVENTDTQTNNAE